MVVSSQKDGESEFDSRFAYLAKPIRDLTKNWNLNIASELEQYLEEIQNIQITFDGGLTTMNFAEAALVIQGSTSVYSKKVEYLFTLVNQMLDLLASKKKVAMAGSVDAQGNDADATFGGTKKAEEDEFFSLDDIHILKQAPPAEVPDKDQLGDDSLIPNVPIILAQQEDTDKPNDPLLSVTGEVLGDRQDFRLLTSILHSGGNLMVDIANLDMANMSFNMKPHSTPFPTKPVNEEQMEEGDTGQLNCPPNQLNLDEGASAPGNDDLPLNMSFGDDDAGSGPMDNVSQQRSLRARQTDSGTARKPLSAPPPPKINPMQLQNVNENTSNRHKVFKKAKTYRLPPNLIQMNRKRKRDKELDPTQERYVSTYLAKYFNPALELRAAPLKTCHCIELLEFYCKELQRRKKMEHAIRVKMVELGRLKDVLAEVEEEQEAQDNLPPIDDGDDDAEPLPNLQLGEAADLAAWPGEELQQLDAVMPDTEEPGGDMDIVSSYEDLVRNYVEGFMINAALHAQTTDLVKRVRDWEDKVLPLLEEEETRDPFDIHTYGTTILNGLEKRNKVTAQGQDLEKSREVKVPFRRLVEHREPYQVCRLFLATLQLANAYNVEIESVVDLERRMDTMTLTLKSTERHHEQIEDYQAPSAHS